MNALAIEPICGLRVRPYRVELCKCQAADRLNLLDIGHFSYSSTEIARSFPGRLWRSEDIALRKRHPVR
jgi:hypothetical protein